MNPVDSARPPHAAPLTAAFERVSSRLHCLAIAITADPACAEDLCQEAFLRVWRRRALLTRDGQLEGYLYQAVRNLARNHVKRRQTTGRVLERQALLLPEGSAESDVDAEAVSAALRELPCEQREVVMLRVYEDLPFREIARLTDTPIGTVHSRFRLALERLRPVLEARRDD